MDKNIKLRANTDRWSQTPCVFLVEETAESKGCCGHDYAMRKLMPDSQYEFDGTKCRTELCENMARLAADHKRW